MSDDNEYSYTAEMGFTHKELLRGLPSAVAPYQVDKENNNVYVIRLKDSVAHLYLSPEKYRSIASITLPMTKITIEFEGFSHDQHTKFLDRFKKYLHRGGG